MSAKKTKRTKALGRGLASLIPEVPVNGANLSKEREEKNGLKTVDVVAIDPMPGQPRTRFDEKELLELSASIKEKGVLQPLLVRRMPEGGYQLIAGERRFIAAKKAGLDHVPVIVKDVDEAEAYQLALIENLQRSDLNPVEVARAYARLAKTYKMPHALIAEKVGKDRASVTNYLRVLKLPHEILQTVEDGVLSFGHARALLAMDSSDLPRLDMAALMSGRLSVRELERRIARLKDTGNRTKKPKAIKETPQVRFLRERLEEKLGLQAKLYDKNGKGRLVIQYSSLDQLDRVLNLLGINE